jgi:hypothetical protein
MPSYFNYKKSICTLDGPQVISALKAAEMSVRTSKAAYVDAPLFKEQVDEIKQSWPAELTSSVRDRIKAHKDKVGPEDMRRFAMDAIRGSIAGCKPYDRRCVAAEMALATLFRRAPDFQRNFRSYKKGGPVIGYKVSPRPNKLVIDRDKVGQAELYVYCYYCEEVDLAMILGYATQEAHFQEYQKLRPMNELIGKIGQPLPSMTLFESPPDIDDLPLEPNRYLKLQIEDAEKTNESEDEKFMRSILGLKDKPKEATPEKAGFDL